MGEMGEMVFGITLPNRGINLGICTTQDLLELADLTEACPFMDSVRISTMGDPREQLRRVAEEVLPFANQDD